VKAKTPRLLSNANPLSQVAAFRNRLAAIFPPSEMVFGLQQVNESIPHFQWITKEFDKEGNSNGPIDRKSGQGDESECNKR
jgi:hypothetical protein